MFSTFFIKRPIFATVLSLIIVLAGLAAMRVLPISRYPKSRRRWSTSPPSTPAPRPRCWSAPWPRPSKSRSTRWRTCCTWTRCRRLTARVSINITFDVGTNLDIAAVNVNNRVRQADAKLRRKCAARA